MDVTWLGWIAGLLGLGVGIAFAQRARSAAELASSRAAELETVRSELDRTQATAQQKLLQQRERADEIAELRHRIEKLKKRSRQVVEENRTEPERLQVLEGQLAQARRDVEAARRAQEEVRRERDEVAARAAEERRRLEVDLEAARRGEEIDALRARAEAAEARAAELEARTSRASADAQRLQRRWESVDRAYLVLRSEKAALEDELRTKNQRIERLEALKVALVDPQPGTQPEGS